MSFATKLLVAVCVSGGIGCAPDSSLKHRCQSDSDCLSGRQCVRSVCQLPLSASRPNYVFVTSQKYPPRFQPIETADEKCNAAATAAGLPGEFRAWLSTAALSALERLSGARGWVRPDGAPFADTVEDIAAGRILVPPLLDEFGNVVIARPTTDEAVATGTLPLGAGNPGENCHEFANDTQGTVTAGTNVATTGMWTFAASVACGIPRRIYCFGVDQNVSLSAPMDPGKIAFLSEPAFQPDRGLAAADAVCAEDAAAAGLPGEFRALLGTTAASAASRFADSPGAHWSRVDGVALSAPGVDLFGGDMPRAPLNVNSRGEYIARDLSGTEEIVLTGAPNPNAIADVSHNCANWTTVDAVADAGRVSRVDEWFFGLANVCSLAARVYCLER